MSRNNVPIFKGKVGSDKNSVEIRRLLLAEMAVRAAKNMLRHYLRMSATQTRVTTYQTQVMLQPLVGELSATLNVRFHTIFYHSGSSNAPSLKVSSLPSGVSDRRVLEHHHRQPRTVSTFLG